MLPQHTLQQQQEEEEDSNTTRIRQQYISSMTRTTNEEEGSSNTSGSGSGSELTSMSMMQTVLSSMMLGSETTPSTNTTTNQEKNDSSSTHSSSTRMLAFPSIGNVFGMEGGAQNPGSSAKKQEELANKNTSTTRMMGFVPSISDIFAMEDHDGDGSNKEQHEHTRKTNVPKATGTTTTTTDQTEQQRAHTMGLFPSISNLFSMDEDALPINNDGVGRVERAPPLPRTQQPHPRLRRTIQSNTVELLREAPTATYDDEDEEDTSCDGSRSQNDTTQQIYVRTRPYKVTEHYRESVFYISISAILGSIVRVYMARWFGLDCELNTNDEGSSLPSMGGVVPDFFTSWSRTICVTTTGQSLQTGGALFIDFPSNVLGSFLIGVITPSSTEERTRLPWLHREHPLQRDEVFHTSLGIGLCGCLTSFASWNTQMVVMLDGKYCLLGTQVITVFFGYFIGLMGAFQGFQFGQTCGLWIHNFRHRNEEDTPVIPQHVEETQSIDEPQPSTQHGVELVHEDGTSSEPVPSHLHKIPLLLTAVGLLVAFVIGFVVSGIEFYRGMTFVWILSPVGSLLRWKLSTFNIRKKKTGRITTISTPHWIPWGTFAANMIATIMAASIEAIMDRFLFGNKDEITTTTTNTWILAILFALKTGVAGSLSTVSTMVKECAVLSEQYPGLPKPHLYSLLTCCSGCVLGLTVYSFIIRINT